MAPTVSAWVANPEAMRSKPVSPRSTRCTTIQAYERCRIHRIGRARVAHGDHSAMRTEWNAAAIRHTIAAGTNSSRKSKRSNKSNKPSEPYSTIRLRRAPAPWMALLVKAGMTRPPITAMMNSTTSRPTNRPMRE